MNRIALMALCTGLLLSTECAGTGSSPTPTGETAASTTSSTPDPTELPDAGPTPQWSNVPYVPEGSTQQRLDVYLPADGEGPFPTILAIHSGGFRSRSKLLYRQMAGPLTESGYAVVSTDYRLAPQYSYPAQVQDVFCAIAWIHANHATYGLDRDRIIAMGDSAGGYLAAMLGTIETPGVYLENCPHTLPASDWLQGVVVYYGLYDFTSIDGYRASDVDLYFEPYWGAEFSEISPETLAEMSPMSWVDGSEPPFLLIHGVLDAYTPSWMSEDFAAALRDSGAEVELLLVEAEHAFRLRPLSDPPNVQSLEAIGTFLAATSE